jgi:sialate O-acetylesterase
LILSLGSIDDFDVTYFNGARVGATGIETQDSYLVPRRYKVSGSAVHSGSNLIAVRVFDRAGGGGFNGAQEQMSLAPVDGTKGDTMSLAGDWRYKEELALEPKKPDWGTRPSLLGPNNPNSPTVLFNAMIAPLTLYAIRGAIWYQGESNASRAYQYRALFPAMIRNWRKAWGEGDFPFYFVQLANWQPTNAEPSESEWAELREAQTMTLQEPHTGMAVIIDIGETNDIHPRNKTDVGHRLAVWALADTYGQEIEPAGPLYDTLAIEGNKIRVRFKHVDGGLMTAGGGPPRGFAIAGADHKFHWAEARLDGNSVIVWSNDVPQPVAVRYGWADNPDCNLYNKADLPASPFRSDDWPGVTVGKN